MNTSIILRHDINANREKSNRILKDGEVFIESTNSGRFFYVGDGHTQLKDLQISTVIPSQIQDIISDINDYNEVTLTSDTNDTTVAKTYHLYQNETEVGQIKIPLDMVVSQAQIITATNETDLVSGNKYIEFTIANSNNSKIYLAVDDVIITYTAAQNAQEIQLSISNEYVMSAEIVEVPVSKLISDQFCELIFNGGDAGGTSIISNLTPTYTLGTNLINGKNKNSAAIYNDPTSDSSIATINVDQSEDTLWTSIFQCSLTDYYNFLSDMSSYTDHLRFKYTGADLKQENILVNLESDDPQYIIKLRLIMRAYSDTLRNADEETAIKLDFINNITAVIENTTKGNTITSTLDMRNTTFSCYEKYISKSNSSNFSHQADGANTTDIYIPFTEGIGEFEDTDIINIKLAFNINIDRIAHSLVLSDDADDGADDPRVYIDFYLGSDPTVDLPYLVIAEK